MAKYTPEARKVIAECYESGMSYESARELIRERFAVDMPRGTYNFQRSYLRHRSPDQMQARVVASIGEVSRAEGRRR